MQGSNPGRGKKCFLSPQGLEQPWGTPSSILHGHHSSFPGVKRQGCDVDRLHLVLRLRMCVALDIDSPYKPSWRGKERKLFMRNYCERRSKGSFRVNSLQKLSADRYITLWLW